MKKSDILTLRGEESLPRNALFCISYKRRSVLKKEKKYRKELPRELYTFFIASVNKGDIPSISKFARQNGFSTERLSEFRKYREFDIAWKEVNEIRRDYLTDSALTKRFDPSFVKFILNAEFGVGEDDKKDNEISVTIKVDEN